MRLWTEGKNSRENKCICRELRLIFITCSLILLIIVPLWKSAHHLCEWEWPRPASAINPIIHLVAFSSNLRTHDSGQGSGRGKGRHVAINRGGVKEV